MAWKALLAAAAAAAAWLTLNLGTAWWVLLALLALDLVLHWRDEAAYLRRLLAYVGSTAAALYVQDGLHVQAVHLLIVGLVAWEAARIGSEALAWYETWRKAHVGSDPAAPTVADVAAAVRSIQQKVDALAAERPALPAPVAHPALAAPAGPEAVPHA